MLRGYEPIVLSDEDAIKHHKYDEFEAKMIKLPTVCGYDYEGSCYRRWLAFEIAAGDKPCLVGDYDVICYDRLNLPDNPDKPILFTQSGKEQTNIKNPLYFSDEDGAKRVSQSPGSKPGDTHLWIIPCLAYGTKRHFINIVEALFNHSLSSFDWYLDWNTPSRPHCSDQMILTQNRFADLYTVDIQCKEVFTAGWETAKTVHYCNGAMNAAGLRPRQLHVNNLRPFFK